MIRTIVDGARRLDEFLQEKLGRPYNILLSIGLVTELVRSVREFPAHALEANRAAGGLVMIVIELALLLHQLGALSHRFHRRGGHGVGEGPSHDPHGAHEPHERRASGEGDLLAQPSMQATSGGEALSGVREGEV